MTSRLTLQSHLSLRAQLSLDYSKCEQFFLPFNNQATAYFTYIFLTEAIFLLREKTLDLMLCAIAFSLSSRLTLQSHTSIYLSPQTFTRVILKMRAIFLIVQKRTTVYIVQFCKLETRTLSSRALRLSAVCYHRTGHKLKYPSSICLLAPSSPSYVVNLRSRNSNQRLSKPPAAQSHCRVCSSIVK